MKTIQFIRHAESQANAGEVTFGDHTISLTKTCIDQYIKLAELITTAPDLVICSNTQELK